MRERNGYKLRHITQHCQISRHVRRKVVPAGPFSSVHSFFLLFFLLFYETISRSINKSDRRYGHWERHYLNS